jgi:IclR family mhp operon transcriptional activator
MGRAYLAFCDKTEREKIIARLAEIPEHWNDLARHPRRLSKMIAETRKRGFSVVDERYSRDVFDSKASALGVPIRSADQVFASVNVVMLSSAVGFAEGVRQFVTPLQRTAAEIVEALTARAGPSLR